jgi:hypothetical protein
MVPLASRRYDEVVPAAADDGLLCARCRVKAAAEMKKRRAA